MDVSVIIPTYKPGEYLWQCLDSLRKQTLSLERYELIIILNGCHEPYYGQIKEYLSAFPEELLVTFVQTDRGGVSNARNIGLDLAKGRYISFIDDDDWVSPSYLGGLLSVVEGENAMAIANVNNYDERTGQMRNDWLSDCYTKNFQAHGGASLMSCRSFLSVACCKLTARKAIGEYRFDTRYNQGEDSLFNAVMSHNLKRFGVASPDVVYYRRIRKLSSSRSRPLWKVTRDNTLLALKFAATYIKGIQHYNFLFFASRILGCAKATLREYVRPFLPNV